MNPHPKPTHLATAAGERGYTLQTLIVTAVVVLLAVAAGVVIIAITRSAQDDLARTPPKTDGSCEPWEIHDLELAARGAGGGQKLSYTHGPTAPPNDVLTGAGGVTSSAIGCLPPCYIAALSENLQTIDTLASPNTKDFIIYDASNRPARLYLDGKKDNGDPDPTKNYHEIRAGVVSAIPYFADDGWRRVDTITGSVPGALLQELNNSATGAVWNRHTHDGPGHYAANLHAAGATEAFPVGLQPPPVNKGSNLELRALAGPQVCEVYDTATGEVLKSSDPSREGLIIP